MDLGALRHIFGFALQFRTWYELLVGRVEEEVAKYKEVLEAEKPATRTKADLKYRRKSCTKCGR